MTSHVFSKKSVGRLNEKLLKLITTNINDIIIIIELAGEIRYISPSVQKILGYSPEETVGTNCFDYYHPDDLAHIGRFLTRAREGQPATVTRFEHRCRRKDGSYCWLENEANRIIDAAGKPAELLLISRDITARKQVEQELMNSYDWLALALDGAKAGVWGFQPPGRQGIAFRQWWSVLGYTSGEVAPTREGWYSLCHPDDRSMIEKVIDEYLSGRRNKFEFEYRIRHKNSGYRWILANGKKVRTPDGKDFRWIGLIIDVTDFKELEAVRRESEMRLRDFARAIPDVSAIVDEDGRYVEIFVNNAKEKLLSRPYERLKGRSLFQGLLAKNADFLVKKIRQTIKSRQPQTCSLEYTDRDGRQFGEVRMAPMSYLADGKKTVAAVLTSVSEKRRAEKLLEFALVLRQRSSFMNEVISGTQVDATAIAEAKVLGTDLSAPLFCCAVHWAIDGRGGNTADSSGRQQSRIIEYLSEECRLFAWDCRNDIGILLNAADGGGPEDDARAAERIIAAITAFDPRITAAVGVGGRHAGLDGIGRSWRQAASAALVAKSQLRKGVCHFRDIGVYKLLANFTGKEEGKEYIRETIGSLIEHDRRRGTDLLRSLEEILRSTNLKEAAQRLFLHYNTIVRQKQRIEKILGVTIEDVETRLALTAAVKLRQLGPDETGK